MKVTCVVVYIHTYTNYRVAKLIIPGNSKPINGSLAVVYVNTDINYRVAISIPWDSITLESYLEPRITVLEINLVT